MLPPRLESLRERLLRAGVAPRHVRRYLRELLDHHDDALRAELARGAPPAEAREAAWARLGTEESLAQGMLERPELRSTAARFPVLVFGVVPVLTWVSAPLAVHAAMSLLPEASRHVKVDAALIDTYQALCFLYTRLLPVVLGAVALHIAAGRRLRALWPLVGAGAVDVLAGTLTVHSLPGQLGISSSLLPWLLPFTTMLGPSQVWPLVEGLARAAGLLALSLVGQRLLRRIKSSDRPALAIQ
jgi:hypothetical protein